MARRNGSSTATTAIAAAGLAGAATVVLQWTAEYDYNRDAVYTDMSDGALVLAVLLAILIGLVPSRTSRLDYLSLASLALLRALTGYDGFLADRPRLAAPVGAAVLASESLGILWLSQ